jgi:hypothetical protein
MADIGRRVRVEFEVPAFENKICREDEIVF